MSESVAERRLRVLSELRSRTRKAAEPRYLLAIVGQVLTLHDPGLPYWALYLNDRIDVIATSEPLGVRLIPTEQFPLGETGMLVAGIDNEDTRGFVEVLIAQLEPQLKKASETEEQLLLMVQASSALLSRLDSPDVLGNILQLAQQFVKADAYALWRRRRDGSWTAAAVAGLSDSYKRVMDESEIYLPVPEEALAFPCVFEEKRLEHRHTRYEAEGIRSMLMVPLRIHREVTATLDFYYRNSRGFGKSDKNLATALGNLAAAAIDISELYAAQEEERRRAMFLASAGTVLAASLDVETTLNAISRLAVPAIADWCTVDLLEPDGSLRRVSVTHSDPEKSSWARGIFERNPLRADSPLLRVLESGKGVLIEELTEDHLRAGARSAEHLEALLSVRLNSSIIVPLAARGEKFGILSLFSAETRERFDVLDLALAEELATRSAIAIHSARLYRAVSDSAERLGISADAAGLGIFEFDIDSGAVLWENSRIYEIFGRTEDEGPILEDEFFSSFLHPDDHEHFRKAVAPARESGGRFQVICRIYRADGALRIIELAGRVDLATSTAAKRMVGVIADITERRKLEERVREAAKLESIGLLAGGVAHDFNNLLTGIMGHASLALEVLEDYHPARQMIANVLSGSERAALLTRQMLAYSGRGKFMLTPVDLSELVREIEGLIGISMPKNAEICLELADRLPCVEADAAEMQQLVMNLMINAGESLDGRSGTVRIGTAVCELEPSGVAATRQLADISPGRYVILEVQDTGCGMSKATLARVFDPFFTTKFTGRGLGLSAVQGIVRGHKGAIEVESEPGRGTTFRVYLPAADEKASPIIEV